MVAMGNPVQYLRAPITEAVIEVKFVDPLKAPDQEKALHRVRRHYASARRVANIGELRIEVTPTGPRVDLQQQFAEKLTSKDEAQIVLLGGVSFAVSQLAPYSKWDDFFGRFARDWDELKKAVGWRKITRVGVRYINRIDIPFQQADGIKIEDYVKFYVEHPPELGSLGFFGGQGIFKADAIKGQLTINMNSIPSPLLDHLSIVLDLDAYADHDALPQNDPALFDLLSAARKVKNDAFEACITDAARELFR